METEIWVVLLRTCCKPFCACSFAHRSLLTEGVFREQGEAPLQKMLPRDAEQPVLWKMPASRSFSDCKFWPFEHHPQYCISKSARFQPAYTPLQSAGLAQRWLQQEQWGWCWELSETGTQEHQAVVHYPERRWQGSGQDRNALRGNSDLLLKKFGRFQHLAGVLRWMFIQPSPFPLFTRLWHCKAKHSVQLSLLWFPLSPPCWAGRGDSSPGVPCPAYGACPWH